MAPAIPGSRHPPGCGIRIYLAATDDADPGAPIADADWHAHRFGQIFPAAAEGQADRRTPRGAWVSSPSEVAFHGGLLACPQVKDRSGLFTALIQRSNRPVQTLRGRFLRVRVEMTGDGRTSPEIAALRAYASRFSYLDHYLPALYRETQFGPDADAVVIDEAGLNGSRSNAAGGNGAIAHSSSANGSGSNGNRAHGSLTNGVVTNGRHTTATPADFLERLLDNFEGILTSLEDRIAGAYLLTDPRTSPADALDWLGGWIGVSFDPAYPEERRRRMLREAPALYREHGTLQGMRHALDIATGGAVERGQIYVLEDFRMRRTFATILGADLTAEYDPLLAGLSASGNSYVGDTLFLGDENKKEFLAVFGPQAVKTASEEAAVAALFDQLAHRVTVLVHQEVDPQDMGLIRRVVEMETPAHVAARIATASERFMVGVASLIGVDTFLSEKTQPRPVRVDGSQIGCAI